MSLNIAFRAMLLDVVREVVREELGARPADLERELLTYEQAAALASCSASTIKRWVRDGALAASGKGKLRRVRAADVRACLQSDAKRAAEAPDLKANVTSILATLPRR